MGFTIGGFFDGVLLHQILQWHHLLSLVSGVATLRAQILWDGYFHAVMYIFALIAGIMLWRYRTNLAVISDRQVTGTLLIGFGSWHAIDAVVSHWILGIHRIRMDTAYPLAWDLSWLVGFGLVPAILGIFLLRQRKLSKKQSSGAMLGAIILAIASGGWSLRAPPGPQMTTIVFASTVTPAAAIEAVVANGGRIVIADLEAAIIVANFDRVPTLDLHGRGALMVSGGGLPAGCAGWSRI